MLLCSNKVANNELWIALIIEGVASFDAGKLPELVERLKTVGIKLDFYSSESEGKYRAVGFMYAPAIGVVGNQILATVVVEAFHGRCGVIYKLSWWYEIDTVTGNLGAAVGLATCAGIWASVNEHPIWAIASFAIVGIAILLIRTLLSNR